MSEQKAEPPKEKPKLSLEEKAGVAGQAIYRHAYNAGKLEGRKESTDPDAKRLGYLVLGAIKMKGKGKNTTSKILRNLSNNVAEDNYASIEALARKVLLMLANATKPSNKKTETPPPTTEEPK